jgi:hypothetical protein
MPSTLDKIDAPVVVKPDTVSNRASMKFGISPEKKNGRQPRRLIPIQLAPTQTNPSFAWKPSFAFLQIKYMINDTASVMTMLVINPYTVCFSFLNRLISNAGSMNTASMSKILLINLPINL